MASRSTGEPRRAVGNVSTRSRHTGGVWGLATAMAKGWVREVWQGEPIITGDEHEAQRWQARRDAIDTAGVIARRRVSVRLVQLDGEQRLRGEL